MTLSSTYLPYRHTIGVASSLFIFCLPVLSIAADDDIYLDQSIRQQSQAAISQQQQAIIDAATPKTKTQSQTKAGSEKEQQTEPAPSQQMSPEAAIFSAINQRHWSGLKELTTSYEEMVEADPNILLFAKAAYQAGQGQVSEAIELYQVLLKRQPDFVRARLELAKLYFQDQLLRESKTELERVKNDHKLPKAVVRNIDAYLQVIEKRESVNGTFSVGIGYETNLNESAESSTCLFELPNGQCGFQRNTPPAIDDMGVSYEATLNRRWQVQGHHGITANLLGYGNAYTSDDSNDMDRTLLNISLGYRYADFQRSLTLTPLIEFRRDNNQTMYRAHGARVNINQSVKGGLFGKPARLSLETEFKDFRYVDSYSNNDGIQWSIFANATVQPYPKQLWFAMADHVSRENVFAANAYKQFGVGLGQRYQWDNGLVSTFIIRQHWRRHNALNALLGQQRKDQKTTLSASLSVPKYTWMGFVPSLTLKHRHNNSNVDWLYDYDASEVWLKAKRVF